MFRLGKARAGTRIPGRQLAASHCRPVFLGCRQILSSPLTGAHWCISILTHAHGKWIPIPSGGPASSSYTSFVGSVGEPDLDDETGDAGHPEDSDVNENHRSRKRWQETAPPALGQKPSPSPTKTCAGYLYLPDSILAPPCAGWCRR